jgi:hypothetical protein
VPGPSLGGENSPPGCSGVAGALRAHTVCLPPGWERSQPARALLLKL